jgi:hypothetical protein
VGIIDYLATDGDCPGAQLGIRYILLQFGAIPLLFTIFDGSSKIIRL